MLYDTSVICQAVLKNVSMPAVTCEYQRYNQHFKAIQKKLSKSVLSFFAKTLG